MLLRKKFAVVVVVDVVSKDCLFFIRVVMAVVVLILGDVRVSFWLVAALLVASLAHQIILCVIVTIVVSVLIASVVSSILLVLLFLLLQVEVGVV